MQAGDVSHRSAPGEFTPQLDLHMHSPSLQDVRLDDRRYSAGVVHLSTVPPQLAYEPLNLVLEQERRNLGQRRPPASQALDVRGGDQRLRRDLQPNHGERDA